MMAPSLFRSGAEVVLFEREATCGGHTLTDDSGPVPVDLGFQVHCPVAKAVSCTDVARLQPQLGSLQLGGVR